MRSPHATHDGQLERHLESQKGVEASGAPERTMTRTGVRIAVAQCSREGVTMADRVALHELWVRRAVQQSASVVVFPELSLVARPRPEAIGTAAVDADESSLRSVARMSREVDIVAGFVERGPTTHHLAHGYWSAGHLVHVHRTVHGVPRVATQDVMAGNTFEVFRTALGTTGIASAADSQHLSVAYLYAAQGAGVLLLMPSPAPGRDVAKASHAGLEDVTHRFYAQMLTLYVVVAQWSNEHDSASKVIAPDGTTVARLDGHHEGLLLAEFDPQLVARERSRNPLLRDERWGLVLRHLADRVRLAPFERP